MKRSELKEAIKAEITSVLSEQSNNPDFDKKVASFAKKINNEMDYPGGVLEAMKQIKSRLERIISKVEDAKRGGAEEEPLMKMIGLKEAMFNEDAVLEDVMLAIDLHLDGKIDYNEMSRRVEDLILGKGKPDFKVMNEEADEGPTKAEVKKEKTIAKEKADALKAQKETKEKIDKIKSVLKKNKEEIKKVIKIPRNERTKAEQSLVDDMADKTKELRKLEKSA